jgi:hypothetical protein
MPLRSAIESMSVPGARPSSLPHWTNKPTSAGRGWQKRRDEGLAGGVLDKNTSAGHLKISGQLSLN